MLVFHDRWSGKSVFSGQCAHWDRRCKCIQYPQNRYSNLIQDMDNAAIGSRSVVSRSLRYICRCQAHWYVWRWIVGLDGVCPGSLVDSMSGFSGCAQLEGASLEGLYHIVHLCINWIYGFSGGNFHCSWLWCWGLYVMDCRKVHLSWNPQGWNSSWDWVRRDTWRCICSFGVRRVTALVVAHDSRTCYWRLTEIWTLRGLRDPFRHILPHLHPNLLGEFWGLFPPVSTRQRLPGRWQCGWCCHQWGSILSGLFSHVPVGPCIFAPSRILCKHRPGYQYVRRHPSACLSTGPSTSSDTSASCWLFPGWYLKQ